MKNKGRKHKAVQHNVDDIGLQGVSNLKGLTAHLTRPITQISSRSNKLIKITKHDKKNWSKRVRGYFKSQTKEILE